MRFSQPTFPGRRFLLDISSTGASRWPKARVSLAPIGRLCVREDSSALCRRLAQQQQQRGFSRVGGGGITEERPGWRGLKAGWSKQGAQPGYKKRKGSHTGRNSPHEAVGNRVRKGAGATRVTSSRSRSRVLSARGEEKLWESKQDTGENSCPLPVTSIPRRGWTP